MTIILRDIQPADKAFLFTVYAGTRVDEMALVDWTMEAKNAFLLMQFDAQDRYYHEAYQDAEYKIIQLEDKPVGRLYVHRRKNEIRIIDISLLPEFRKQRIGSTLLGEILEEGKNRNLPVTIHVERFNPALHLYERLGFRQMEDKGVYYLMEWKHTIMEQSQNVG
jgi:ribosomal protein S18 acetylase RimI-like enzyme